MFKSSTKIMAFLTLILSTTMVISSENWFSMWMGLEINMISFIPIIKESKNYSSPESKMMYFLVQSLSSLMFIFSIIMTPMSVINEMSTTNEIMIIITISMMMKMGMAPMHMWFINILSKLSWDNCLIIMTWQKIAPMWVMSNLIQNDMIIKLCSMSSVLIGAIGGINQTSIKKVLAFSSVNHLGWMVICLKYNNEMWMKYLLIYSGMIMILTKILKSNSINYINQMNMNMKSNMSKINMMMMMLSIGGLPPFLGFLPKWIVISALINESSMTMIMILMFSSMITLFYYIRMMSPTIMMWNQNNKWNIKNNEKKSTMMTMMIINMSLPMTMMLNLI